MSKYGHAFYMCICTVSSICIPWVEVSCVLVATVDVIVSIGIFVVVSCVEEITGVVAVLVLVFGTEVVGMLVELPKIQIISKIHFQLISSKYLSNN